MKKVLVNQLAWVIVLTASMTTAFPLKHALRGSRSNLQAESPVVGHGQLSQRQVRLFCLDFPKRLLLFRKVNRMPTTVNASNRRTRTSRWSFGVSTTCSNEPCLLSARKASKPTGRNNLSL